MEKAWESSGSVESGPEAGRFDQTHLIAAGRELTALVALYNDTTTGLHTDHPGADPAESG